MKEAELFEAYHNVTVETRHIMALCRRMTVLLNAAMNDMHKLERAVDLVQDLEQKVAANVPPDGAV